MAAAMKFQNYLTRIFFCFIIFIQGYTANIFPLTGHEVKRTHQSNHKITLPDKTVFPFRGSLYKNLFVSKDGAVGFRHATSHKAQDYTKQLTREDPAFVAPFFFSAQDIGTLLPDGQTYKGQTLYRDSLGTDVLDIPYQELANYSSFIEQSMIGVSQFNATFGLVVTWLEVISQQDAENCKNPCNKNSTFQVALLTDGTQSFAIFNYVNMETKVKLYTQAGFNAGEGRGYVEALNRQQLVDAQIHYGSDVKGRYIFKIDGEHIVRGGCYEPNTRGTLNISPTFAGMFGGEMIDISGPCMTQNPTNTRVKCRFDGNDNLVTYGYKINTMKARCSVPMMSKRGFIHMELSINDRLYFYSTHILIVDPSRIPVDKTLNLPFMGTNKGWNETKTDILTLEWDDVILTNTSLNLNISLVGYKETNNGVMYHTLQSLGVAGVREKRFSFDTPEYFGCNGNTCNEYELGFVMAEISDPSKATAYRYLVSRLTTLGFYVNKAMVIQYGESWPSQKCQAWYDQDKQDMNWLQKLDHCPCNLVQALSDIGRWQPDVGCYLYDTSSTKCHFHKKAEHCIRSVQPSPDHAGVQCCYSGDGSLLYSADSFEGSTPDRSHAWGAAPYGRKGMVPSMSHWVDDVVTFYYCCLWTGHTDCDKYMDLRPTRDCSGYQPPTPAKLYGQGHIQTFDGAHHRMCGNGDFILLRGNLSNGDPITVQGRFVGNAFSNIIDRGNSSVVLTNIGVRVDDQIVEIRLKLPTVDRSKRYLDVIVNKKYYFFENKETQWQDFSKFVVVNSDRTKMGANYTIILKNGLGIQVADCNNTLCVLLMAPPSKNMGKIEGLLGNYNGNATDDLLTGNTTVDMMMRNGMTLHDSDRYNMVQYKWAVKDRRLSILPVLTIPTYNASLCWLKQSQNVILPSCGGNQECLFDYRATGDVAVAMKTKEMSMRLRDLRTFVKPVRSCGLLNVPRSIKSNYNYKLGQTVTVQGCRVGSLTGDHMTYTCVATSNTTQRWSPSVDASCTAVVETANTGMIVGIVVGVLVFLLIVAGIVFLVRRMKGKKANEYGPPGKNPVTEGSEEYSARYSRPHKPHKVPQEDPDVEKKKEDYSL